MKYRAAIALIVVLLWAGGASAHAANKTKGPRTLAEYLSSLKEPRATAAPGRTLGSLWSDNAGIGQLSGRLQGGPTERFDHRKDLRADDRQPVRDGECATLAECQLRDHRSAGRSEDHGRCPTVLAELQLPAQRPGASKLKLEHTEHAFGDGGGGAIERRRWWWKRATRSWRTTSTRTSCLRGVVRPGDIASDNSILSSQMSNLELEIRGKGVVSDGTRQPNIVIRTLLRLLNF